MVSPREKLLDCRKIHIFNESQYRTVLDTFSKIPHEEMFAVFGVLSQDSVDVLETEALPKRCYRRFCANEMEIDVAEFQKYCSVKCGESGKIQDNVEVLGTGHVHKDIVGISKEDQFGLSGLGFGILCFIYQASDARPEAARVYAPSSEDLIDGRYLPALARVENVKLYIKDKNPTF